MSYYKFLQYNCLCVANYAKAVRSCAAQENCRFGGVRPRNSANAFLILERPICVQRGSAVDGRQDSESSRDCAKRQSVPGNAGQAWATDRDRRVSPIAQSARAFTEVLNLSDNIELASDKTPHTEYGIVANFMNRGTVLRAHISCGRRPPSCRLPSSMWWCFSFSLPCTPRGIVTLARTKKF